MSVPRRQYSSWNTHIQSHWGKKTWDALFLLAADYPHEQSCKDDDELSPEVIAFKRESWKRLFQALPGVLSCPKCGAHFKSYMERDGGHAFREALKSREALFKWLHKCKDEVNRRTSRKSVPLQRVRRRYIAPCSKGQTLSRAGKRTRREKFFF
jgi:hypothetical protein